MHNTMCVFQNLDKGGLHLGKPSQIWISPIRGSGGSGGPPDPDFLHVNKKIQILGGGGGCPGSGCAKQYVF